MIKENQENKSAITESLFSFLHPAEDSNTHGKPQMKTGHCIESTNTEEWIGSVKQQAGGDSSPPGTVPKRGVFNNPERKTFLYAVKERSSQLPKYPFWMAEKKTLSDGTAPSLQKGVEPSSSSSSSHSDVCEAPHSVSQSITTTSESASVKTAETHVCGYHSSSTHAQSVAQAKYRFLFGNPKETIWSQSGSTVSKDLLQAGGSGGSLEAHVPNDDFEEDLVFLEINEDLARLLNSLNASVENATVASSQQREPCQDVADDDAGGADGAVMIPRGSNYAGSPDMAGHASDEDSRILDLSGLDSPGDLFLSPTYLLDSWSEALLRDTVPPSPVTEEQSGVSGNTTYQDVKYPSPDGLEKTTTLFSDWGGTFHSGPGSELRVPFVAVKQPGTDEAVSLEAGSSLSTKTAATLQGNGILEESTKILAKVPDVFAAFLDGGELTGTPIKKLRFSRSTLGSSSDDERVITGQMEGSDRSKATESDVDGMTLDDLVDSLRNLEMVGSLPAEDARKVPGVFQQMPDVQETHNNNATQANGIGARGSGASSDSPEATADVFSWRFERILESENLCNTLYSSMDSLDALSSSADDEPDAGCYTDAPLTPMIQQRLREPAHFLELVCDPRRQEVLSVMATGKGGKAALEVTSSFLEFPDSRLGSRHQAGTHSPGASDVEAAENAEQEPQHWLHGCMSKDGGLTAGLFGWDSVTASMGCLKDSAAAMAHNGTHGDQEAARRLARRLYHLEGFRRSDVANHLGKNDDFSKMVAEEYLTFFEFTGMTLDQSLRFFLKAFALRGETQERERVLIQFSNRYYRCNPSTITSQDGVHCLACALMLLNTDLHGNNIGKRMTCQEFIDNLSGLNEGQDFPQELLKELYNSIKNEKIEWATDGKELQKSLPELSDKTSNSHTRSASRIYSSSSNPFLDITHDPNAAVYKASFLARKVHADMNGKKTPKGKRGWKTFYAVLKGMILYLQKEEHEPDRTLSEEDLKNAISIHHSLSIEAMDYDKKPNVLKLKTADWRVFLFQAQSHAEMCSWIGVMNSVAALFSAPPFPAAIGSQKKFSRPLLPATSTRMSREEQLKSHEAKLKHVSTELAEHKSYPPDKKIRAKEIEEYKLKEHYLEFEENRYEIYVNLLKEGMKDLLPRVDGDAALKVSQSSPFLTQETQSKEADQAENP